MSEQTTTPVQTEIAIMDDAAAPGVGNEIVALTKGEAAFYSSIKGDDLNAKVQTLEAMSNAENLADHLSETIKLANIIIQEVTLVNKETGKVDDAPRITLIDEDGKSFVATSVGVFSSVKQLIGVAGEPGTWGQTIDVHFVEQGQKPRRYMTMRYGAAPKAGK